jgi:hypothetical protein
MHDRATAGSGISPAPIAQARPTQNDWLSSLTKSSDVTGLARTKHARIARCRNFQATHFKKKHGAIKLISTFSPSPCPHLIS